MEPQFLIVNIVSILSVITNLVLGFFVFFKNPKKEASLVYLLLALSISWFFIFFILGINSNDILLAYKYFAWATPVLLIFGNTLAVHFVLASFFSKTPIKKILQTVFYISSAILFVIYLILPANSFLGLPVSKMYFPNFIVAGEFYWTLVAYFAISAVVVLSLLIYKRFKSKKDHDDNTKNKVDYYIFGVVFMGYGFGSTGFPLVYGVDFPSVLMPFFGLYTVPLAYGIIKFLVLDIQVVAKRASLYGLSVTLVSLILLGLIFSNQWLVGNVEGFPFWLNPVVASIVTVGIGGWIWYKMRELDTLKYEFITIVTHKFRTPLTRIKWSVETLKLDESQEERDIATNEIKHSAQKLVDLTDMLVDLNRMSGISYQYRFEIVNLNTVVQEVYDSSKKRIDEKDLKYNFSFDDAFSKVVVDKQRFVFVLQILFENAISYTPSNGKIEVDIKRDQNGTVFSISDTGIGISEQELPYIFSKFYRSRKAKLIDTEGMGIGLFMSRRVIEHHGGRIWITSKGPNLGSTIFISLPEA